MEWVTMVARDVAPSRAFEMLKPKLEERRIRVAPYLGGGKPFADRSTLTGEIESDVVNSQLLLLGMSCSPELAKEEIAAARIAMINKAPFGFYADLFGCSTREWFAPFRSAARFVFVLSEEEARKTRTLFPHAEIVASGNPVLEEAFEPTKPHMEVRAMLGVGREEALAYCTAGKDKETNRANFKGIAEAFSHLPNRQLWKLFFMLHPGDQTDPSVYSDVVNVAGVSARLVPPKEIKAMGLGSLDLVNACDLMVASVSTSGVEAACRRKPVIDHLPPLSMARMKEQSGSNVWPPCEFGVSRPAYSAEELAGAIQELTAPGGFDEMRARQEACFPAPKERGAAVKMMTDTIMRILG